MLEFDRGTGRAFARFLLVVSTGLAVAGTGGCKRKDKGKCDEALRVARDALGKENTASAREWREYAYKHCADTTTLQALDSEIVAKEAAIEKKKAEEAAKKQRLAAFATTFGGWVAQHRANPTGASVNVTCDGDENPKKERWCTRSREISGKSQQFTVRYWEAEPEAAVFSTKPAEPVGCDALGPHQVMGTWDVPSTTGKPIKRARCKMTGGSLSGLQVLATDALGADLFVIAPKYLEKDATLGNKLR